MTRKNKPVPVLYCYTQPCTDAVTFVLEDPDDLFAGAFTCEAHAVNSLRTYTHWAGGKALVRPIRAEDLN